ncbi:MAG TPA: cyclic nucleotide-binding domain-containing protein [Deltaproteobacteria bacterium]|nr:cyclic nucleotide-binding domain-containing protein [Deltaproteobacteria bacterium]HPR53780.1 cyclic nucleotide-binding domain-containing protein [Deltaproteobacteria bacterium]HXK46797.1 cyclic nucleotide-binding domain-containing protein [Deltaproteobacteria bacterium]
MNNAQKGAPGVRELLDQAVKAARRKDEDRALSRFEECIREYVRKQLPFKAIAVSKRARTVLGPTPRVRALVIRTYRAAGFTGDARQELESAAAELRKKDLAFLAPLDEEAFLDLLSIMEIRSCPKGRVIVKRQDPGEDVFLLISGACEIIREGRRLSILRPGDVFGEIGFFGRSARSATVKTMEKSVLVRIPSDPLRTLQGRHACLHEILERIYSDRIMKKVREDMEEKDRSVQTHEVLATFRYAKGEAIPVHSDDSIAVLKHGIVEVDFEQACLVTKRYLKPGSVISRDRVRATASSDVEVVIMRVQGGSGQETEGM